MQTGRHCKKAVKRGASEHELAEAMCKDIDEIIIKYKSNQKDNVKASDKFLYDDQPVQKNPTRDSEVQEVYEMLNLE